MFPLLIQEVLTTLLMRRQRDEQAWKLFPWITSKFLSLTTLQWSVGE